MSSSIPPLPKQEEKVDTSKAVSVLKEAAIEVGKKGKTKVSKRVIPQPAKIDAKAVQRKAPKSEKVEAKKLAPSSKPEKVADKKSGAAPAKEPASVSKKSATPAKESAPVSKKSAAPKPKKREIPKPVAINAKAVKRSNPLEKPPSKVSDRVPEKVVKMSTAKVSAMASKKSEDDNAIKKTTARVTLKAPPASPIQAVDKTSKEAEVKPEVVKTEVVKSEPPKKESPSREKAPAPKPGVTLEEQSKRPWWKFWGKAPEIATNSKADELVEGAERPPTEEEMIHKRHEALIDSVNQICHSLEVSSSRPIEVKTTDLVPLIPGDNIDSLNRTQELVSGVLTQVSGRLEKAGERDAVMIDSLTSMDKSITSLNDVGERTISTMDGMKGILSQVSGAMSTMQTEMKQSSKRYEELCEKVQKTESDNIAKVQKLQKSALWINVILGIALVGGLIAVAISKTG